MAGPVHGLPLLVHAGLEVAVVPPELKRSRWHRVVSCSADGREGALITLSGVDDLSAAEALVGRYLLARAADLPADLALHDADRLIGREIRDAGSGERAVIEEVMRGPANDVWVLHGARGELLLPVIDEVVRAVPDEGPIEVRVPEGLEWEEKRGAL